MNQTALITGASSGIGLELARLFARSKHHVILVARSVGKLEALAEELRAEGVRCDLLPKDLQLDQSPTDIYEWCRQQNIQVDYLVNNAGLGDFGLFHESDWSSQKAMIQVNMNALTHLTHLFLPDMVKRGSGKVLNIASTAAFQPGPYMGVYFATKAYVLHFSEAIANELKGTGVTVTAHCPSATESGFFNVAGMENSGLVKGRKLPGSAEVAKDAFAAMMKGSTVRIPGFLNHLLALSPRFSPRNMTTAVTRMMVKGSSR